MRYLWIVLLSFSVFGVEELQTLTVTSKPFTFIAHDVNVGRGEGDPNPNYRVRRFFKADGTEEAPGVLERNRFGITYDAIDTAPWELTAPDTAAFINENMFNEKPYLWPEQMKWSISQAPLGTIEFVQSVQGGGYGRIRFRYTPAPAFTGDDEMVVTYTDGNDVEVARIRVRLTTPNTLPQISVTASPALVVVGSDAAFFATTSDADGQQVTVSYDYGDGTQDALGVHAYQAPGVYAVTATANDGFGGIATAQTSVTVVSTSHIPTARITTSGVVAFAGLPFVLDGITSSDPENALTGYSWDFGDGTPKGSTATITHVFATVGVYTVSLTVTDAEGLSNTLTREIEVLSESDAATFDGEVTTTATYFPARQNRDVLTVFARVNIGDMQLASGSTVAVEYAGQRFEATLNKRLRALGWVVKQNLRRQAPGTVEVSLRVRNVAVASVLSALGAVDDAVIDVPVRVELGGKTIEVQVPTDIEQGATRGKATGAF